MTLWHGQLNNRIYIVSRSNVMYMSNKYLTIVDVMNAYLWHCRLAHIHKNRMNRLAQEELFYKDNYESLPTCESCLLEKMTKLPFIEKGERASDVLGMIHTDVCGSVGYKIPTAEVLSRIGSYGSREIGRAHV